MASFRSHLLVKVKASVASLPRATPRRLFSAPSPPPAAVQLLLVKCDGGESEIVTKTLDQLKQLKEETKLPLRDLRMFFNAVRREEKQAAKQATLLLKDTLPAILARPSSNCFLLNLDQVKLLCSRRSCLILRPENASVQAFVADLCASLQGGSTTTKKSNAENEDTDAKGADFEAAVLECALSAVTNRLRRHLNLLRPISVLLLQETSTNPSNEMLRRMLAFRKGLNSFESSVSSVRSAVSDVLKQPVDLEGLCLAEKPDPVKVEAIEFLLEAYNADLKEMEFELGSIRETIDDTQDFIHIHLDAARNKIIKMSLFMEMGTLSVGSGALAAGIFGMNLTSGLESHPSAFYMTVAAIATCVGGLFGGFAFRYANLSRDVSGARGYQALAHFNDSVVAVEKALQVSEANTIDRHEFRRLLSPVVSTEHLRVEEVEAIFASLDRNGDGVVDLRELTDRVKDVQSKE